MTRLSRLLAAWWPFAPVLEPFLAAVLAFLFFWGCSDAC